MFYRFVINILARCFVISNLHFISSKQTSNVSYFIVIQACQMKRTMQSRYTGFHCDYVKPRTANTISDHITKSVPNPGTFSLQKLIIHVLLCQIVSATFGNSIWGTVHLCSGYTFDIHDCSAFWKKKQKETQFGYQTWILLYLYFKEYGWFFIRLFTATFTWLHVYTYIMEQWKMEVIHLWWFSILAPNGCFSYRNFFQNGVDALSKISNAFLSKISKFE